MMFKDLEWDKYDATPLLRRISDGSIWAACRYTSRDAFFFYREVEGVDEDGETETYNEYLPSVERNYDLFEFVCMLGDFELLTPATTTDEGNNDQSQV